MSAAPPALPASPAETLVSQVLAEVLCRSPGSIARSTTLKDLGAESLDLVEIAIGLESAIGAPIPDADIEKLRTVGDLVDYVERRAPEVAAKRPN